eukprot:5670079-Pyramimonas_sp.AAC.1
MVVSMVCGSATSWHTPRRNTLQLLQRLAVQPDEHLAGVRHHVQTHKAGRQLLTAEQPDPKLGIPSQLLQGTCDTCQHGGMKEKDCESSTRASFF